VENLSSIFYEKQEEELTCLDIDEMWKKIVLGWPESNCRFFSLKLFIQYFRQK